MKKILRYTILSLLACITPMASCDKIQDGQRTIFAGAAGKWVDGQGVEDHSQRIFLEKYTGPRCPNCPRADKVIAEALTKYNGTLIAVSVHDSSYFGKPYGSALDLRTADGNIWSSFFGLRDAEKPIALINRNKAGEAFTQYQPASNMDSYFDTELYRSATIAIDARATMENGTMNIDVNLEFLQDVALPLTLTALIIEDGLITTQNDNGNMDTAYVNNHILRDVITDVWGVDVDADGKAGTKRFVRFTYQPSGDLKLENCHIVAFVSDKASRHILNTAETDIK